MSISGQDWAELEGFVRGLGYQGALFSEDSFRAECLRYLEILQKKNEQVNLTALRDLKTAFWKHLADSLALLAWEPLGSTLDWGSGGGLPGVPLALARKFSGDSAPVSFLDSVGKKVRAVEEFCSELALPHTRFFTGRGEEFLRSGKISGVETVVMRAVAPPERAVKWLHPSVPNWIFFLGPSQREAWEKELPKARQLGFSPYQEKHFFLPEGQGERVLFWISKRST